MTRQMIYQPLSSLCLIAGLVIIGLLSVKGAAAQSLRSRVVYPKSDVTLEVAAITFPNEERNKINMLGTDRFINLKGSALIEREKGKAVTAIKLDIGRLPHPSQVCNSCGTYVVWAITPEGQADNLGEFRKRGSHTLDGWFGSEMEATTRHQTFSIIITAEPYYLVSSPSRNVVATNADPSINDNFNRLRVERNTISFNGDSDFDNKIVSPSPAIEFSDKKFPIELRQARFAVEIASYYQAGRYDARTFHAAESAYKEALATYANDSRNLEKVLTLADLAIRQADMARRRAVSLAKAEKERRLLQERDDNIAALDLSLREKERALKETSENRARLAERNNQLEYELSTTRERVKQLEADNANLQTVNASLQTANAALQARVDSLQVEKARMEASLNEMNARCNQAIKCIADVDQINSKNRERVGREFILSQSELGVVLSLPDRLFSVQQPTQILPQSLLKIDLLADYLKPLSNHLLIETFAQGCGSAVACRQVTEQWAQTLAEYLIAQGVARERIAAYGRGSADSAASSRQTGKRSGSNATLPQIKITIKNLP